MLITCRRVKRDLLISMLSLANLPQVPVAPMRSDPAKSTNSNLLLKKLFEPPVLSKLYILIVSMEWLRELCTLSLCEALILFLMPIQKYFLRSFSSRHSKINRFQTLNCSSLFHLSLKPAPPFSARAAGFSRSKIRQLQICRKERQTEQVHYWFCCICWKSLVKILGMIPEFIYESYPCMVQVLPEPVCPQAKIVAWQPLRVLSRRWSIWQSEQISSWVDWGLKIQSKLQFLLVCPSLTSTQLRQT